MRRALLLLTVLFCVGIASVVVSAQTPMRTPVRPQPQPVPAEETYAESDTPAESGYSEPEDVEPEPEGPTPTMRLIREAAPPPAEPVKTAPAGGIDPKVMAERMANSMGGASGGRWDPTLGSLSTGKADIDGYILESSSRYGVDPKLILAVMYQESGFKQKAISPKGASGYMQLMPATARRFGVTDIFDPKQNIDAGTKYMRFLLDLFDNNVELALAGYNAGEYRVIREGYRVPRIRETQNYVKSITARYYGRSARNHSVVTYGPSRLTKKEKEEIAVIAYATTDDFGTGTLSNNY